MQGLQYIFLCSLRGCVAPVAIEAAVAQALLNIDPLLATPLELAEATETFFAQVGVVALEQPGAHSAVLPAEEWAQLAAPRAGTALHARWWRRVSAGPFPVYSTHCICITCIVYAGYPHSAVNACSAHALSENS